jgi:hypothetical protein
LQINHHFLWLTLDIFELDARLLQLRRENLTVVMVVGESPGADQQAALAYQIKWVRDILPSPSIF